MSTESGGEKPAEKPESANPHQFKPGHSGNKRGRPPGSSRKGPPVPSMPEKLRLMKHVFKKREADDKTTAVKQLREFYKSSPGQFLKHMDDLEKEHKAACQAAREKWEAEQRAKAEAAGAAVAELPVEEREKVLLELIDGLLARVGKP